LTIPNTILSPYSPQKATLFHALNHCEAFLGENERRTWRQNSVLNYKAEVLKERLPDNIQVFADLESHKVDGQTIPQSIVVTTSRPDLVVIDNSHPQTMYLFELTVCFE
jgi:hypothetical protein